MNPSPNTPKSAPLEPTPAPVARRKSRVCTREACESCREKKAKCNGASPCARCASRGMECRYETRSYQTKRSLKAELQDLRDGQRRLDAVIAALATPDQSDRVLRKLWDGNTVAEIYETISGGGTDMSPPPTVKEEVAEPEGVAAPANWAEAKASASASISSSRPSMSTSPFSVASEQPASGYAQDAFEFPPAAATGSCYTQAGDVPFGACLDDLTTAAAGNQFGQPMYATSPLVSDAFIPSPLQSFDASMMSGVSPAAAGAGFQQPCLADDMGGAGWWACHSPDAPVAMPSFPSMASADSLTWGTWQFPSPMGADASGSLSVPSVTPSPTAPHSSALHPPPPRDPDRESVVSSSFSDALDCQSHEKGHNPELEVPAASTDDDYDHHDHHDHRRQSHSRSPPAMSAGDRGSGPSPPSSRERNRQASARSWQRQKRQLSELQDAKDEAEARNRELRRQHSRALAEVLAVKDALMGHAGCNNPAISGWLQNQASKFVMGGAREVAAHGERTGTLPSATAKRGSEGAVCR